MIFRQSCSICTTLETFWVLMRNRTSDFGIHVPMPDHFISVTKSTTVLNLSSIKLLFLTNSFTHSFFLYFFFPTDPSIDFLSALMHSKSSIHFYWIYVFTWELRWQFFVSVALWCFPWQPSIVINLIDGPTMDFQGIDGTNHLWALRIWNFALKQQVLLVKRPILGLGHFRITPRAPKKNFPSEYFQLTN